MYAWFDWEDQTTSVNSLNVIKTPRKEFTEYCVGDAVTAKLPKFEGLWEGIIVELSESRSTLVSNLNERQKKQIAKLSEENPDVDSSLLSDSGRSKRCRADQEVKEQNSERKRPKSGDVPKSTKMNTHKKAKDKVDDANKTELSKNKEKKKEVEKDKLTAQKLLLDNIISCRRSPSHTTLTGKPSAILQTNLPSTNAQTDQLSTVIQTGQPSTVIQTGQPSTVIQTSQPSTVIQTSQPSTVIQTSQPSTVIQTSQPSTVIQTSQPSTVIQTSQPSTVIQTNQPTATFQTNQPTATCRTNQPTATIQTNHPTAIYQTNQPTATCQTNHPTATNQTNQPRATCQTNHPTATIQTNQPTATNQTNQPTATYQTNQLTNIIQTSQLSAVTKNGPPSNITQTGQWSPSTITQTEHWSPLPTLSPWSASPGLSTPVRSQPNDSWMESDQWTDGFTSLYSNCELQEERDWLQRENQALRLEVSQLKQQLADNTTFVAGFPVTPRKVTFLKKLVTAFEDQQPNQMESAPRHSSVSSTPQVTNQVVPSSQVASTSLTQVVSTPTNVMVSTTSTQVSSTPTSRVVPTSPSSNVPGASEINEWEKSVTENGVKKVALIKGVQCYLTQTQLSTALLVGTDARKLAIKLLECFFSREELAAGNASGKRQAYNGSKSTQPLCQVALRTILEFVLVKFKSDSGPALTNSDFNKLVNSKCSTARRGLRLN